MKHIWIGGVAPKKRFEELSKLGDCQFAANNTQLLYIDGLEANIGENIKVISSHFIPNFLHNKLLLFKRSEYDKWTEVGFLNIPILKQITKTINVSREVKKIIKNNKSEEMFFYIYSMTTPLMHSAKVIKKYAMRNKIKAKIVQIVPDLPQYMNFKKNNYIWQIAKKIDIKILMSYRKYIDKYVLFSNFMVEKLNINSKDCITIEGMIKASEVLKKQKKEKVIMYAGGINEKYGVYDLIHAFKNANINDYELHLFGPCSDLNELKRIISDTHNVKYFGSLSREEILIHEAKASLLVNPRKSIEEFTKYSFPSKTMEYLLSGTPVLMYRLQSIPKEYDDYLYYIDENKENDLQNKLESLCKIDSKELEKNGDLAKDFLLKEKNNIIQCKKIIDFIE